MDLKEQPSNGASNLIEELNKIFSIYAKDLKTFREGGAEFELLGNSDMFDVVVKLLNVSDKIKKLNGPAEGEEKPVATPKVKNLQDIVLNGNLTK